MKAIYHNSEEKYVSKYIVGLTSVGSYALLVDENNNRIPKDELFRMFCTGLLICVVDSHGPAYYEADAYFGVDNPDVADKIRFYDNEGSEIEAFSDGYYQSDNLSPQ